MTPFAQAPDGSTADPGAPIQESHPARFTGRLVLGLAVITLGVLFLLDALDIPGIGDIWHYVGRLWPCIFLLIGITKVVNARSPGERLGGVIWLVLGGLILANNFDIISFNVWRVFWPAVLIVFGLSILSRSPRGKFIRVGYRRRPRDPNDPNPAPEPGNAWSDVSSHTSSFAIMSGVTRRLSSPDFKSGDATAVMGGCEIDLRQCSITTGPAVFDVFALMGGIELYVPGDWTVRNEGIAILGAIEDSRKETAGNPAKVLLLRGAVIMGGVEIKN